MLRRRLQTLSRKWALFSLKLKSNNIIFLCLSAYHKANGSLRERRPRRCMPLFILKYRPAFRTNFEKASRLWDLMTRPWLDVQLQSGLV